MSTPLIEPAIFVERPINIAVTEEQWDTLKKGSLPQSMEEKWTIFYRDGLLNFHRVGHTLFRTKPEVLGTELRFLTLFCRREIAAYAPNDTFDEVGLVTKLIHRRLATPSDEPWFGWDHRHPRNPAHLAPDFSDFLSK